MPKYEIIIAGRGGQGILLMGHILGIAAAKYQGLFVTGTESYGAETRGGDSRADVIIASKEDELDFIKVRKANIAIFMYSDQVLKYQKLVAPNAYVFLDQTYISNVPRSDWKVFFAPYTEIAERILNTSRVANMIALGHMIGITKIIPINALINAIKESVKKAWVEVNIKALNKGVELAEKSY